jgi:hypothetical protein
MTSVQRPHALLCALTCSVVTLRHGWVGWMGWMRLLVGRSVRFVSALSQEATTQLKELKKFEGKLQFYHLNSRTEKLVK